MDGRRTEAPSAEAAARGQMVARQLAARDVRDPAVLAAMGRVPRHLFVPPGERASAYEDWPLPIGEGATISQPYIVARMTECAGIRPGSKVLEIGTGSGYQAAVLAELGARVWSIEIVEALAVKARARLAELGHRVEVMSGDGYHGLAREAPFDAILLTAAPREVPPPLLAQLAPGGVLVAPVGEGEQELVVVTRGEAGFERRVVCAVRFVPMTGEARR